MLRLLLCSGLVLALASPVPAAEARPGRDTRRTLAFIAVTPGEGYSERQAKTIQELMLTALTDTGRFKVFGPSDINALLTLEAKKQAAGCSDSGCAVEIAGALGAEFVATADVGMLGKVTIVSLKVLDVRSATVVARAQKSINSSDELVSATQALASQVVIAMRLAPVETAAPSPVASARVVPVSDVAPSDRINNTVAVLYFDYDGSNPAVTGLRKGLAQMLITDLSSTRGLQVVERAHLQEILTELKLGEGGQIDPASASRIGKLLGARFLVMGGYFELMGSLRVDARVVEVETGRVVRSVGSHCSPDQFMELEQQLAGDLKATLASVVSGAVPASRPPSELQFPHRINTMTVAEYGKALDDLDHGHRDQARSELQAVVKKAPDFALAQADLNRT